MKTCIYCNKEKHEQSFHVSGNGKRGNVCHACKDKRTVKTPEASKKKTRRQHLKRQYGITVDDYDNLFNSQFGRCAICSLEVKLYVDHDHETGNIRGLLCNKCNSGLGFLNDNPDLLSKAHSYLVGGSRVANP